MTFQVGLRTPDGKAYRKLVDKIGNQYLIEVPEGIEAASLEDVVTAALEGTAKMIAYKIGAEKWKDLDGSDSGPKASRWNSPFYVKFPVYQEAKPYEDEGHWLPPFTDKDNFAETMQDIILVSKGEKKFHKPFAEKLPLEYQGRPAIKDGTGYYVEWENSCAICKGPLKGIRRCTLTPDGTQVAYLQQFVIDKRTGVHFRGKQYHCTSCAVRSVAPPVKGVAFAGDVPDALREVGNAVNLVEARLRWLAKASTGKELAKKLGFSEATIYMARQRGYFTVESMRPFCNKIKASLAWVQHGEGEPFYADEEPVKEIEEEVIPDEVGEVMAEEVAQAAAEPIADQLEEEPEPGERKLSRREIFQIIKEKGLENVVGQAPVPAVPEGSIILPKVARELLLQVIDGQKDGQMVAHILYGMMIARD